MRISTNKRIQEIVDLLQKNGYVASNELAEKYNVSMETIRKDLMYLEEKGIVKKEYGGASLIALEQEASLDFRQDRADQKNQIARCVAKMIMENHSIILDSGSTCIACCKYMNLLPKKDIITNSLDAFMQLNGDTHNVFFTGGKKREKNHAVIGNWTEAYLNSIQVDVCILGTAGLLNANGPTSHSYSELSTKKAMIEHSDLVYVVADSKKFNQKGFHTVVTWDKVDGIITDSQISPNMYQKFNKIVPVIVAGEENEND